MADKPIIGTPGQTGVRDLSPVTRFLLDEIAPAAPQAQARFSPVTQFLLDEMPNFTPEPEPVSPTRPSVAGEFTQGLAANISRLGPEVRAVGGLAADAFGAEETAQALMTVAAEKSEDIEREYPTTVTFDEAFFTTPENAIRFIVRNLGEQTGTIASLIAGGGLGGLLGRLVGRGALTTAEGVAAAKRFGQVGGAIGTMTGIETAATGQELFAATGEIKPGAAFAAGIAKGSLEAIVPLAFARRFGLSIGQSSKLIDRMVSTLDKLPTRPRRIGAGFVGGGVIEGATEVAQEAVDIAVREFVDENFDALSPETVDRLIEAGVTGAIVGAVFGGIGGGVGGKPRGRETPIRENTPLPSATEGTPPAPGTPQPASPLPPATAPEEGETETVAAFVRAFGEDASIIEDNDGKLFVVDGEGNKITAGFDTIESLRTYIMLIGNQSEGEGPTLVPTVTASPTPTPATAEPVTPVPGAVVEEPTVVPPKPRPPTTSEIIAGITPVTPLGDTVTPAPPFVPPPVKASAPPTAPSDLEPLPPLAITPDVIPSPPAAPTGVVGSQPSPTDEPSPISGMPSPGKISTAYFDGVTANALEVRSILDKHTGTRFEGVLRASVELILEVFQSGTLFSPSQIATIEEIAKELKDARGSDIHSHLSNATDAQANRSGRLQSEVHHDLFVVLDKLGELTETLVPVNRIQREAVLILKNIVGREFFDANEHARKLYDVVRTQEIVERELQTIEDETSVKPEDVEAAAEGRRIPASLPFHYSVFIKSVAQFYNKPVDKVTYGDIQKYAALHPGEIRIGANILTKEKRQIVAAFKRLYRDHANFDPLSKDMLEFKKRKALTQRLVNLGIIVTGSDRSIARLLEAGSRYAKWGEDRLEEALVDNELLNGDDYRHSDQEGGTAVEIQPAQSTGEKPVKLSKNERATMNSIVQTLDDMLKFFKMDDFRLVVAVETIWFEGKRDNLGFGAAGAARNVTANTGVIFISKGVLTRNDPVEIATLLAHEFGHTITIRNFFQAAPEVQMKIIAAFDRSLQKGLFGDVVDFVTNFRNIDSADFFMDVIAGPGDRALSVPRLAGDTDYYFSFVEWLAEETSRWFTSNKEPLTLLDRNFKGVAKLITEMYHFLANKFGLLKSRFHPSVEMAAWLESMRNNHAVGSSEALKGNILNGLEKSNLRNSEHISHPTPDGEMTHRMDGIIDKYIGGEKGEEIKSGVARMNWMIKWGYTIRQLSQLKENVGIRGLQLYNELIDAWYNLSTQWKARAEFTIKEWRTLSKSSQDSLAKFLFELDAMLYLGKKEAPRLPTDKELADLVKKHKLTAEAFAVYEQIRADFTNFLNKIEEIAIRDIQDTVDNKLIQIVRVNQVQLEFNKLRARPYFPHSRFGDFTVVVKDKKGKTAHMEQFVTRKQAVQAFGDIRSSFPETQGYAVFVSKMPEEVKPFRGLPPTLLRHLKTMPGLKKEQQIWIDQLIVELSPTVSFRKRLARRKDVPGHSLDAMRSYANYFWHGSNYLARLEFQRPLQEAINAVRVQARDPVFAAGKDVSKLVGIADFMQNHFDQVLTPGPDWAQLRSLAFIWWLGFSPKAAAINLTQMPMVTYPYLAARYGDLKSLNAMKNATKDFQRLFRLKTDNVPDTFLVALTRAIENGVVDESYAMELAAVSEGRNLRGLLTGTDVQRTLLQISHWSAFMFQTSEKINRRITFSAAWQLAMKDPTNSVLQELKISNSREYHDLKAKGFGENEALAYLAARDAVWSTQFQYSNHARPRFIRGRKGTLLTFFTFMQNMVHFAAHDRGRTRFYLMMFAMAGLMGLPGSEDMFELAKFIGRKVFGVEFDIEKEVREFVVGLADDPNLAELVLHGTSRFGFGFGHAMDIAGLPAPKFDISGSVGLGRIVPGLAEIGSPTSFDATFSRMSTQAAGATFGIGINLLKFMADDELSFGDFKRWERAMPAAAKSVMRAGRFLTEERERTRTDATVLNFDANDPDHLAEIVALALGFHPTRLAIKWDRIRMEREATAFWAIRRGMLLKQFDRAIQSGDREAIRDMRIAIRRYNNEVAITGYKISGKELSASVRERTRRRRLFELGIPQSKRERPLVSDIQALFPDVDDTETVEDVSNMK